MGHFASDLRDQDHRARRRGRWNLYTQRFAELSRVIEHRIAPEKTIPQTDDASVFVWCMARHLQARCGEEDVWKELYTWCKTMAPWVQEGAAEVLAPILRDISDRKRDLTAKELGQELQITWEERCLLDLRTIRPFGMSNRDFTAKRDERKRQIDRENAEAKRREAGQMTWSEHSWQHRHKPWTIIGCGQRTWHRYKAERRLCALVTRKGVEAPSWILEFAQTWDAAGAAEIGTVPSRITEGTKACDEKVPTSERDGEALRRSQVRTRRRSPSIRSHSAGNAGVSPEGSDQNEGAELDDSLRPLRNFEQVLPAKGVRHARQSAA